MKRFILLGLVLVASLGLTRPPGGPNGSGGGGGGGSGDVEGVTNSDGLLVLTNPGGPVPDISLGPTVLTTGSGVLTDAMDVTINPGYSWDFSNTPVAPYAGNDCTNISDYYQCLDVNGLAGVVAPLWSYKTGGVLYHAPMLTAAQYGTPGTNRVLSINASNAPTAVVASASSTANAVVVGDGSGKIANSWLWSTLGAIDTAVTDTILSVGRMNTEAEVRNSGVAVIPSPDTPAATGQGPIKGATAWEWDTPIKDLGGLDGRTDYANFPANPVVLYYPGRPRGNVACTAGSGELNESNPTELGRKIVWNTNSVPNEAWICTGTGTEATAKWELYGDLGQKCRGSDVAPWYCDAVSDVNGDGNIADDIQSALNGLIYGASAAEAHVYLQAPTPGTYSWSTQVRICADDTPPTGSNLPDCTGTTGVLPTIHWVGDWGASTFYCTVQAATNTTTKRGCLSIGDAQQRDGTIVDGWASSDASIAGGEVWMQMESPIRMVIVDDGDGYSGSSPPIPFECLGCRGLIRFDWSDDAVLAAGFSSYIGGQSLRAYLSARTSELTYYNIGPTVRTGLVLIGPHKNSIIDYNGYNAPLGFDAAGCINGCGDVEIRADMQGYDDVSNMISLKVWDSPRISGRFRQRNGALPTHSSVIEFEPDNTPGSPMRLATLGPLDIVTAGTTARGAITIKSCSATVSPIFYINDTRITIADGLSTYGGGISARKDDNSACNIGHGEGEMPPIVHVSGYSFSSLDAENWAFSEDEAASVADIDGIIISDAGKTYQWFTNDVADVAAGECLNFAQDSDGTDMHLPCTDERTMLRPTTSTGLFVAWSRVDIGNDAIDAGEGCKLTPNYNGSADTDTDHILISGDDANVEAVDTTSSAAINRIVTAGQTLQFQLEDAAADNCTDHVGVRWSAHVIPVDSPLINDAPFGDAQP